MQENFHLPLRTVEERELFAATDAQEVTMLEEIFRAENSGGWSPAPAYYLLKEAEEILDEYDARP